MTVQPEPFYELISNNFNLEALELLCTGLNVDYEDLRGSSKKLKALSLQDYMSNRGRISDLIAEVHRQRPHLDLKPYLYYIVAEAFPSEQELTGLFQAFGLALRNFGETEKFAWGSEPWREHKALSLQAYLEDNARQGELLATLRQNSQFVDLSFYEEDAVAPVTSGLQLSGGPVETALSAAEKPPGIEETEAPRPATPQFENFDVHIGRVGADGKYPITVLGSPRGRKVDEPIRQEIPLEDPAFQTPILYLRELAASTKDTKALGEWLRQLLMPGDIWDLFVRSRDDITAEQGLRVRLQIDRQAAELAQIPWEYLYYQEDDEFLALRRSTPIVRYIERNYKVQQLAADHPRLLVAMASPEDPTLDPLDENGETELLRKSLDGLDHPLDWELITETTYDSLQKKLKNRYDILHFVGHGLLSRSGVGALAFEDEAGQLDRVDYEALRVLLRDTGVKLVVLTACESAAHGAGDIFKGVAQSLVQADIPAVIAMQFAIDYQVAQDFIHQFYHYLAAGQPLDRALTEARINAFGRERARISWGIPVLFMQSPDGVIWAGQQAGGK